MSPPSRSTVSIPLILSCHTEVIGG
jgi:hypothetical protein